MSFATRFRFGFSFFWSSFAILRKHKSLRKYIYLPLAISLFFLVISIYLMLGTIPEMLLSYVPLDPGFFYWLLYALFFIFTFLFVVLGSFLFANIVALPFNAILCEKYWKKEFLWKPKDYSVIQLIKITLNFALIGIIKATILVLVALLCFILSFIPILSLGVAFIGLLILAFDCSDLAFELLEFNLKERFGFMKKYFFEMAGFATAMTIVSIIPAFNFIFLPFMVLSASHMVYTLNKNEAL